MIITIGREYGSGGRVIGECIAEKLGVPCYDKQILVKAAEGSGLCPEIIAHHEERGRLTHFFAGATMHGNILGANVQMPINQQVYLAQTEAILQLAEEGPCVIVGRCADYVLRERKDLFRVFFYAGEEARIRRIMQVEQVEEGKARELIRKTNKERKNYYNFFTEGDWGLRGRYDAMLRTDGLDKHTIADTVIALAKAKLHADQAGSSPL